MHQNIEYTAFTFCYKIIQQIFVVMTTEEVKGSLTHFTPHGVMKKLIILTLYIIVDIKPMGMLIYFKHRGRRRKKDF